MSGVFQLSFSCISSQFVGLVFMSQLKHLFVGMFFRLSFSLCFFFFFVCLFGFRFIFSVSLEHSAQTWPQLSIPALPTQNYSWHTVPLHAGFFHFCHSNLVDWC